MKKNVQWLSSPTSSMSTVRKHFWTEVSRGAGGASRPEEEGRHLLHAGGGEEHRRVVVRHERGRGHLLVATLGKEVEKGPPDLGAAHVAVAMGRALGVCAAHRTGPSIEPSAVCCQRATVARPDWDAAQRGFDRDCARLHKVAATTSNGVLATDAPSRNAANDRFPCDRAPAKVGTVRSAASLKGVTA